MEKMLSEKKLITIKRGESVCIESDDGIWPHELCVEEDETTTRHAGKIRVEEENAMVIYTPDNTASFSALIIGACNIYLIERLSANRSHDKLMSKEKVHHKKGGLRIRARNV